MTTTIKDRPPLAISVDDAAHLLGISRYLAFEGVRDGSIPSVRIGRRILVPVAALERMLEGKGGETAEH